MAQRTDIPTHRLSVSHLPAEVEQEERDFMRLLEKALAPGYTLVKRLGAGGMGTVYLARDPALKRLVAVKVLSPALAADPAARARFEREAQAVAAISHPNVVAVYSVGTLENGVPYLVMQYVEGRTMAERLQQEGPLDARSAKRVIGEIASAIAAAHRKNIVHRDIKPANVLLDEENGRAMVTDFGIAAVLERADDREAVKITHTGVVVGTPANMSPEQLLAEPITDKTDIYSLGVLGYELFLGEGPYHISSPREVMAAHLRDTPRKLSKLRPDIDPELERLLEECLAKEPAKRPGAAEVEKRLQHGATVLLEWPPPGTEALSGKLRTATRFLHFGAAGFALPVVALTAFDRTSTLRQALPPVLVLFAFTAIGFLVFVVGLEGLRRFVRDARRLVAAGYGWGTVFEAAADSRGDTGALIAGGREYAELSLDERSSMRRNRVLVACLRIAAGILPVLGFGIGITVGTRTSGGPAVLLSSSIVIAALCFGAASTITARENTAMRAARQRIRTTSKLAERANQLADVWTQSFEQVRAGQRLGTGPRRFQSLARVLVVALGAVLLVEAMVVILAMTLTTGFEVLSAVAIPKFNTTTRAAQLRSAGKYRAARDSSITALRAGQALHAIVRNGPSDSLFAFEKRPAITIPAQAKTRPPSDPFAAQDGGFYVAAFRQAPRGFSIPERDFLRSLADNTALEEFRILGRAVSLDFAGAYWDIRPDAVPRFIDLPIPKYRNVATAADANIAAAALDFAAGRRAEAEQRLRETINAGFLMIDDSRLMIEALMGSGIVKKARSALATMFEMSGRVLEAKFLLTDREVGTAQEVTDRRRPSLEEVNADVRRIILDEQEVRAVRWELLFWSFAAEPCSDLHQVVFGADSLHRATYERARKSLIRNASDSLMFLVFDRSSDRPPEGVVSSSRYDWQRHEPLARVFTALTGSRQLEACLGLFGG